MRVSRTANVYHHRFTQHQHQHQRYFLRLSAHHMWGTYVLRYCLLECTNQTFCSPWSALGVVLFRILHTNQYLLLYMIEHVYTCKHIILWTDINGSINFIHNSYYYVYTYHIYFNIFQYGYIDVIDTQRLSNHSPPPWGRQTEARTDLGATS